MTGRPLTPPYVPFAIRRFSRLSAAHCIGLIYLHIRALQDIGSLEIGSVSSCWRYANSFCGYWHTARLSLSEFQVSTDSTSRCTPLSFANSSCCQSCNGLSPSSYRPCRAYKKKGRLISDPFRYIQEQNLLSVDSACSAAFNPAFFHEAVIVAHRQMRFKLAHGIEHNPDHNQQTGAAEK